MEANGNGTLLVSEQLEATWSLADEGDGVGR